MKGGAIARLAEWEVALADTDRRPQLDPLP
jgi:hypothetical protein